MKKIILLCSAGMSSSILVRNMQKAAAMSNFDCTIEAFAFDSYKKVCKDADCVLLGPQVGFQKDLIAQDVHCPIVVIDRMTYGVMDGNKALDLAKGVL